MGADVVYLSRFNTFCGVSTYTEQLATALSGEAVSVQAAASDHAEETGKDEPRDDGASVPSRVCWSEDGEMNCREAIEALVEMEPRIVHVQHEFGIFRDSTALELLCSEIRKRLGDRTKIALTAHTVPPTTGGAPAGFFRLISDLDAVVVHSELCKRILAQVLGRRRKCEIGVIPHGLLPPQERLPRDCALEALGLPVGDKCFTLLSLGFISRQKRQTHLLRLVEFIMKRRLLRPREMRLIIAGMPVRGGGGDEMVAFLKSHAAQDWAAGRVHVFPDFIPFRQLPAFYGASDATVHMGSRTFHSSSGSVRMDLSFGMPAIVQKAELTQDLPPDAVMFFNRDVDLASRIPRLASRPDLCERFSQGALQLAERRSWRATALDHLHLYERLVGASIGGQRKRLRAALFHASPLMKGVSA